MSCAPSLLLLGFLFAVLPAQGPITVSEVLVLLEAGVGSDDVLESLDRGGSPGDVTGADVARAAAAGASPALLARLEAGLVTLRRIQDLAGRYDVYEDPGLGLGMLVPRDWAVTACPRQGGTVILVRPRNASATGWFRGPTVFLSIQDGTGFPPSMDAEIADRVRALVVRRLDAAGMNPRELAAAAGPLGPGDAPEARITGQEPGVPYPGVLVLRTRVLPGGRVLTLGGSAPDEEAAALRTHLDEIGATLALARIARVPVERPHEAR